MKNRERTYIIIFLETVVLTAFILFWDIIGKHKGFYDYSFNPYWITIFLASAWWGLGAFLLSITEFMVAMLFSLYFQKMPLDLFTFSSSLVIAALFGSLLGLIGENFRRKIQKLIHEIDEKNSKVFEQKGTIEEMQQTLNSLKEDIFLEGNGLSLIFQRLRELEIFDTEEMLSNFVEIIADVFDVKSLSIYKKRGSFLRFVVGKGRRHLPNSLKIEDSLVIKKAFESGKATINEVLLSGEIKEYEPWMAVLIGEPKNNYGVVVIEDIDKLSQPFNQYMYSIAQWLHDNIENTKMVTFESILRHKMPDGTWDKIYYERVRKNYEERMEKFGIPYSEMCLSVDENILKNISQEFRSDDVVTVLKKEKEKALLKVLLSVCDDKNKELISNRLKNKYEERISLIVNC